LNGQVSKKEYNILFRESQAKTYIYRYFMLIEGELKMRGERQIQN